jgi:hypothetical protein
LRTAGERQRQSRKQKSDNQTTHGNSPKPIANDSATPHRAAGLFLFIRGSTGHFSGAFLLEGVC